MKAVTPQHELGWWSIGVMEGWRFFFDARTSPGLNEIHGARRVCGGKAAGDEPSPGYSAAGCRTPRRFANFARVWVVAGLMWFCGVASAEVIPPAPERYFNDYANVVSAATVSRLNSALEEFERQTSSQIIVAVFPKMQSDSSIDDYTQRVYRAWRVGQKGKNNGAALFVFVQDHKMFIQTGYGLEGALPDALCKRIIDQEIAPRFKQGDFDNGLSAGVAAMIAAAKGEYKGSGRTANDSVPQIPTALLLILAGVAVSIILTRLSRRSGFGGWFIGGGGFGGWSGGGGGFGGGGGGGFTGGGGSGGGGGAGGSW